MSIEHNPDYIHHQDPGFAALFREFVFGAEDGMVSTLGTVTGIATATQNPFTTVLSGFVIISVESVAMAVGSYLSSKSEQSIDLAKMEEERVEIAKFPDGEKKELTAMLISDGWSSDMAQKMSEEAATKPELMLKEMAYRELKISPDNLEQPLKNAAVMGISYVFGGAIPLLPYLLFDISTAIMISIGATLISLFGLGVFTVKFSKRPWWKSGLEMLFLASAAAAIGYGVGQAVDGWWMSRGK